MNGGKLLFTTCAGGWFVEGGETLCPIPFSGGVTSVVSNATRTQNATEIRTVTRHMVSEPRRNSHKPDQRNFITAQ